MSDAISERPWETKPPCGWCEGRGHILVGNDFPWLRPLETSIELPSSSLRQNWKVIAEMIRETWSEALGMGLYPVEVQLGPQEWATLVESTRIFVETIFTGSFKAAGSGFQFCGKSMVESSVPGVVVVVEYKNERGCKLAVRKRNNE